MAIRLLPTAVPNRSMSSDQYVAAFNDFIAALPLFVTDANALAASLSAFAAGGAFAIPYIFDTSVTAGDPGNGKLRMSSATQSSSTSMYVDLLSTAGNDVSGVLDTFDASTSVNKGKIRLVCTTDTTKWITFDVTARTTATGYRTLTIANAWGSSPSPFANNDSIILFFQRNGDRGDTGSPGTIVRRVTTVASSATPTPDSSVTDLFTVTALAATATFGAPLGTPADGQGLMIRIKDNGTARSLLFNTAYRASTDLLLPSTTVAGKTLYMGFVYNSADAKWDFVSMLNNF